MIGIIGLGVMGDNLILNFLDKGSRVCIYNRTAKKLQEFIQKHPHPSLVGHESLRDFCGELEKPRKILLMVKAGDPVDQMIDELLPFLEKEDTIIDGGNSYFKDSVRRHQKLKAKGINYIDCGISGGAEGARNGPSMMVGGEKGAVEKVMPLLTRVAASEPNLCLAHVGGPGFGHFVKMVHNGIEYACMQLIAESFQILRNAHTLPYDEIAKIFGKFNRERLHSYLMEITVKILQFKENDEYLVNMISDVASEKGTGRWTSLTALELGVSSGLITSAVDARFVSQQAELREHLNSKIYGHDELNITPSFDENVLESALYFSICLAYLQGFDLIRHYAQQTNDKITYSKIAMIWRGGCIIRARLLENIGKIVDDDFYLSNHFVDLVRNELPKLQQVVSFCAKQGLPIPVMSQALNYILGLSEIESGASLIQAQRDFFGAHTYTRTDKDGVFHTEWEK